MRLRHGGRRIAALLLVLLASDAVANNFTLDLEGGYRHSDNVDELPVPVASSVYEVGTKLAFTKRTSAIDAGADGEVLYRKFSNDAFAAETQTRLRAAVLWTLSDDRLYFLAQDNEGEIGIGSRLSLSQEARERINVFTAGPDYFVRVGDEFRVRVSGRYSNIQYQKADLDGDRVKGEVSVEHSLDTSTIAQLAGFATHSTFKREGLPSNTTSGATVGLSTERRRSRFEAYVGVESLQGPDGTTTGLYGRLDFRRFVSAHSFFTFEAMSRIGDASDAFVFGQAVASDLGQVVASQPRTVPARQLNTSAKYELDGRKLFATLAIGWFRERTAQGAAIGDVDAKSGQVSVGWHFTPAVSLSALGLQQDEGSTGSGVARVKDRSVAGELEWRVTRTFALRARVERVSRVSSPSDFQENRYSLLANWAVVRGSGQAITPDMRLRPRRGAAVDY